MSKIATRIRFFNAIIASDRAWSSLPEGVCKQYWYSDFSREVFKPRKNVTFSTA
ncbi:hypothetical protein [Nostoc favosum]|uniref:Transposase n=1 Tax=Nostoc favosum CHAB5714 TaxID=2780399 RepID=A0ABS8I918_9NOSO|nr:hypothetical protein [Nostoc favosum]MCC5600283.1 hypothetical protein [Nostoc favosum CHAB5714]